ncbi:MAG: alpha/beta hydrolase family protein [Ramlibacter sp.]
MGRSLWLARGIVAVAAVVQFAASAADGPAPIPVQAFFEKPAVAEATISPTGRHVALVAANKDGRNQLVVVDTATLHLFVAAASRSLDVGRVRWVNEKRLVYSLSDPERSFSDYAYPVGLFAVDRDGNEHRDLTGMSRSAIVFGYFPRLLDTTRMKDSDEIFVGYPQTDSRGDLDHVLARRVDTRTGRATPLDGPPHPVDWDIGPGDVPRLVETREDEGRHAIQQWDDASRSWTKVESFDAMRDVGGFSVIDFADANTAYVLRRPKGSNYSALYAYDLRTRTMSAEPLVNAKGFDLSASVIRSKDRVLGIHYTTDAQSTAWFDPAMKKVQDQVDALLPSTVNRISVPVRAEVPVVLVSAYSDTDPGQYFVYDTQTQKLVSLAHRRPAIDPARMARRDFVHYKARDGLDIPAWVTTPRDGRKGPRPMVVLVHGGPWVRGGSWGWDDETQFLASRGYVVIEPEFRGSTGYGFQHFKAGWKQWGLAMQDDVADGARWAIAQGLADPKRICIAGASYGGYATLMGLAKDPDLYRCGVNWVGVTDIDLMYSVHWDDSSDIYKRYGMPVLVADREKDAAQIKATSPVQLAAKIRQPLLLAYGGRDVRVPIRHGTEFRDAVMKTNPDVEWVVYPDEGHGWREFRNNVDFWTRVEKFLAKNIGP